MTLRDNKGFSFVELLLTGTIAFLAATGYVVGVNTFGKTNAAATLKSVAANYASELAEAYRSMKPEKMTAYLSTLREVASGCPLIPGDFTRDGKVNENDEKKYFDDLSVCGPPQETASASRTRARGAKPPNPEMHFLTGGPEMGLPTSPEVSAKVDLLAKNCTSDANGDGFVSELDYEIYKRALKSPPAACGAPACAQIPGDFNRDGKVDAYDLAKWTQDAGGCDSRCADANGDGKVDGADKEIYQDNFGKVSPCGIPVGTVASLADPAVYKLCSTINPSLEQQRENKTGRMYWEGIAQLPVSFPAPGAYRSFKIQIVNMNDSSGAMTVVQSKCGKPANEVVPEANEIYMVQSEVGWAGSPPMHIAMGIPRQLASAPPEDPPTADIRANPVANDHATGSDGPLSVADRTDVYITWRANNITGGSCRIFSNPLNILDASGLTSIPDPVMRVVTVDASVPTVTYTLICNNRDGIEATDSVTVNVTANPIVDLKANGSDGPVALAYNSSVDLSWTSSNATSCILKQTGDVTVSPTATSNSRLTRSGLTISMTYTITCSKTGRPDAVDTIQVNVSPPSLPSSDQLEFIFEDRYDKGSSAWEDKDIRICIEDANGADAIQYDPATQKMYGSLVNQSIRITYEKQNGSVYSHEVFVDVYSGSTLVAPYGGFATDKKAKTTYVTVQPGQEIRVSWYCVSDKRFCKSPDDPSYRDNNLRLTPTNGKSPEWPPAPRFYTDCDEDRIN